MVPRSALCGARSRRGHIYLDFECGSVGTQRVGSENTLELGTRAGAIPCRLKVSQAAKSRRRIELTPPACEKKFRSVLRLSYLAARALRDAAMASIIKRSPFTTRVIMAPASTML